MFALGLNFFYVFFLNILLSGNVYGRGSLFKEYPRENSLSSVRRPVQQDDTCMSNDHQEREEPALLRSPTSHFAALSAQHEVFLRTLNAKGFNVLHVAAFEGDSIRVQALIPAYVKASLLDTPTSTGKTALAIAASNGNEELVKMLVNAGADISKTDTSFWYNSLHWATRKGHSAVVRFLASLYAQAHILEAPTKEGDTALVLAKKFNHEECVNILIEAGACNVPVQQKKKVGCILV